MGNTNSKNHGIVLHIPEGTAYIENRYYSGRDDFTEVIIPDSVQNVGIGAFADCTTLETVILPAGMSRIRKELFSGCTSLRNVQLPSGASTIGEWAFRGCSSLEAMEISENVTEIAAEAFLSCPCLVIIATPGSYAENFAKKHGIPLKKRGENS